MDEDRGLGRNILKALGQRDKDDDFEDAVNYANEGKNSAVLRYVRTAINKTLKEKGFKFYKYLATEYHEYPMETVFIKDTCLDRVEIDIDEFFK